MAPTQASAVNVAAQNMANRANLIQTGLYMTKKLMPVTGALGQAMQIPLERIGISTGVLLMVTVPVNVTVAATQSPFGPYNLVRNVSYTDYAGILRVNTSGYQLHVLNCMKMRRSGDNSSKMAGYLSGAETGIDTDILSLPTAVANANITFSLYVPLAYDPSSDLRGAVLSQTIYGDHYITLNLQNALTNADALIAPYTAGTVALQAGAQVTVQAFQHYIMPQQGVQNLPAIDLSTIYAVEGGTTDNANIAAGASKFINWPNNRAILSATHIFDNGGSGVLNGADLNQIILLGNSNTNIREMTPQYIRRMQRQMLGYDLASGVYYLSSRAQPITTQLYGNVQTRFDIATVNANPYFTSQFESTYLSGTPLPGVIQ